MPTRILREGIITSETVNSLSPEAELFYRRLMSVADDYGRYYAHAGILRASCYPLQLENVSESDVKISLEECVNKGLLHTYGDKKYVYIVNFGQQRRSPSKFPEPSKEEMLSNCKSNGNHLCSESESESESVVLPPTPRVTESESESVVLPPTPRGTESESDFLEFIGKLSRMYLRKPTDRLNSQEERAVSEVLRRPDRDSELEELKKFQPNEGKFFPQTLLSLAEKWGPTLDRARVSRKSNNGPSY